MKNILVIGGNGFIGENLCHHLVLRDYNVSSFDIHRPKKMNSSIRYIEGDFFDNEILESALEGIDVVFHSLSTVNPGNSNRRYMLGYSRDFVQSCQLFDLCSKRNIKVIFLSSGGTVYGVQKKQPILEESLANPINHYGSVKLCIESALKVFNKQAHAQMIIARVSNPYGPGQDFHKGVGFVDAAIKNAINNQEIEVWGDGTVVRDYIYIDDVCEMLCDLIEYDGEEDTFNISSNNGISLNEILNEIRELGYELKVNYKEGRSVDVQKIILDNTRIKKISNTKIKSFKEGLAEYATLLEKDKI